MSDKKRFTITYSASNNIEFSIRSALTAHLSRQEKIWQPFLASLPNHGILQNVGLQSGSTSGQTMANVFEVLKEQSENSEKFNRSMKMFGGRVAIPPSDDSIEGQLVLGLFANSRLDDAISAYLWFVNHDIRINARGNKTLEQAIGRGHSLATAAYASAALPFQKTSSQKLAGAARTAASHASALLDEVEKAQQINASHSDQLTEFRESLVTRSKRIESVFVDREKRRKRRYSHWLEEAEDDVSAAIQNAEKQISVLDHNAQVQNSERDAEFERLKELFFQQLQFKAPVALWNKRAAEHKKQSKSALVLFAIGTLIAIGAGTIVPFWGGDYIADSFFVEICRGPEPSNCSREFSAKGPLTVSGLLVVMSLILWAIRLQYRVYLSERHLALDASEKRAFAETFLAMREGNEFDGENEAIVLASLFRPTQDGIIKDDDGALDLSAAALIARQLGRNS